ncbi:F-actin capping protein alpha subunit [Schizosaccharomyces pombe]|uniref:F-actin-capping protein subunit alpha n=1 Tax=Schizosaccharomyces pombe (strain 972 / ATCC 24843) TaxID=284812 RepID=CAPZA_SCHPO|nr:F-actin-capping protein alpha subunit [Schizosaccharomyces pombe]Q10434.1 RecName: Full=F-actin-capping protein subunit alpha [Schizosaccharomyces pombe 972h-]CAA94697.1 F-actin capping protein alpha subunit [Schizosaccharomyces pombe]|eukprot:NP_594639.1 F-actin-capping protein alpha subunit [Schizosaccharomyces pombe]
MEKEAIYKLIRESPPGEVNQVVHDIRDIGLSDEEAIHEQLKLYHEDYNSSVSISDDEKVIISADNRLEGNRYYDQVLQKSFTINYETMEAENVEDYTEAIKIPDEIVKQIKKVASDHYLSDVTFGIIKKSDEVESFTIVLVSSKYNPKNYWNGSWRCICNYNVSEKKLEGRSHIRVHYYEDGNVWLDASRPISATVEETSKLYEVLAQVENGIQQSFNVELSSLNDKKFKELRRQLPVTRQKINWENVSGIRMRNT